MTSIRTIGRSPCLILVFFLLFCCGGQVFFPRSGAAQDARLTDVIVTNSRSDVLLYLKVVGCFTPEMEEGIMNGIPAAFTYLVQLHQKRTGWPDREIAAHTVQHTLTYDSLREECQVELSEKPGQVFTFKSLAEAKAMMAEISGLKVVPVQDLVPNAAYQLRVKTKLARKTLPLNFHYVLPFVSLWDFETDWYTVDFRY